MLDLLIEAATVVDGSGAPPYTADVAVAQGRIVEVKRQGRIGSPARERLDAHGAWLTPGFIDIHTHYDGQACWDELFSPSLYHGVTTLVMGNCGVGFAPLPQAAASGGAIKAGAVAALIALMEGVEDIPGVALSEGVPFNWQSFPQYMAALEALPHSLDFLVQVPHDPLRMAVMGERAVARQAATAEDIVAMRALLREALQAGAVGFSTGRTDNHRTAQGLPTPASESSAAEIAGIVRAFDGLGHGVVQVVSDFDLMRGGVDAAAPAFAAEFDLVEALARACGRPLSMTWLQRDPGGLQWQAIQQRVEAAVAQGLPLHLQTAARGIGVINGLDASFHPFMGFPAYKEVASLPLAQRAAALREPARKARLLSETSERLSGDGTPVPPIVDVLLARIETIAARMFALPREGDPDYAAPVQHSFYARAKQRGCTALEALYDYFIQGDGEHLVYFPIFNYNDGDLRAVAQMLQHPRALLGLSDAGAHVGTVCDASFSTFMLTHWRLQGLLKLEQAVQMLSARNAAYLGLLDRGHIAVGQRADLNLIDPSRLALGTPSLVRDLPAGGKRFMQKARGYVATWVAGQAVQRSGVATAERPGRLVRMGQR